MRIAPVLFLIVALPVFPQDPVTVNPKVVKVEFENGRIRVLRIQYAPHEKLGMHEHSAEVGVRLTKTHNRQTLPDGTSSESSAEPGSFFWREPTRHEVENLSDEPVENIEIELKKTTGRGIPLAVLPSASPAAKEPIPVQFELHHHVRYENQYVRILETVIEPGDTTSFHVHRHDVVIVNLNDGLTQMQDSGKDWGKGNAVNAGSANFREYSKAPVTHRVKNVGNRPVHDVVVEFLQ